MDLAVVDNEKIFELYSYLPTEVRAVVVDEMEPTDRCRFTRCSQQSGKEARSSKKFLYSLEVYRVSQNNMSLYVKYSKNEEDWLVYRFLNNSEGKHLKKCRSDFQEIWRMELCPSTKLFELLVETFEKPLQSHQKIIRKLDLTGFKNEFANLQFGIESLNMLEELIVDDGVDIPHILSKTQRSLKNFTHNGEKNLELLWDNEKIYSVSNNLVVPYLQLDIQQFRQLSASNVKIHIGTFTIGDVQMFIESWQNGEIRSNFEKCEWHLAGSDFDSIRLFQLLGAEIEGPFLVKAGIEQIRGFKVAELICVKRCMLTFSVNMEP